MPEPTYSRQSESDAIKASARLPGLDIDIIHRQSPDGDWEQMSINLRATPSFDALGRSFEPADPFALWARAVRLIERFREHDEIMLLEQFKVREDDKSLVSLAKRGTAQLAEVLREESVQSHISPGRN